MLPQNQSVADIAKETGLSKATLYTWRRKAREKGLVLLFQVERPTASVGVHRTSYRKNAKTENFGRNQRSKNVPCRKLWHCLFCEKKPVRFGETARTPDQRQVVKRPAPKNKLTKAEQAAIVAIANSEAFKSLPPSQIVPTLADKMIYIAFESTFYRVLREHNQQHHRGYSKAPTDSVWTFCVLPAICELAFCNLLYYIVGISLAYALKDNRAFCKYICPVTVFLKPASYFA